MSGKLITVGLILFFGLVVARSDLTSHDYPEAAQRLFGHAVQLTGQIVDEPDVRTTGTRLVVVSPELSGKVLLTVPRYPEWHYGDELKIIGTLERPANFATNAGREFDYVNYLAKDDIYAQIFQPRLQLAAATTSFSLRRSLFELKQAFLNNLSRALPEPHASLLAGIIIGAKRALGASWQDAFRRAGLSHVVVLSGYNITIVAEWLGRLLSFLPPFAGYFAGGAGIILFTLMAGASTTAIRAAIMALLVLVARATGRLYQSLNALLIAMLVMVILNPKILVHDLSFQLSCLATLGVILGPPILEKYLKWLPEKFGLRETATTTLSAQAFVLPWIVYKMGQLSLVAPVTNLLILPFVPITMLLGFLAGLISFASHLLALPFAYASYLLLGYDLGIVSFFSSLPFAAINLTFIPAWLVAIIYVVWLRILYGHYKPKVKI